MRNRPLVMLMLVFGLAVLLPRVSFGWGREGHEIVARIAEDRLTPRAKAAVENLLGDKSMADVASWADEIRQDRSETGPWHYIDIPYEMHALDLQRDGKNGNNVVEKTVEFANLLKDGRAPRDKQVEALKFLIHFMGDIHQPLHCADRNDDKGGNMRLVFFLDEPKAVNLHKVWDTVLIKHAMEEAKVTTAKQYAAKLESEIDEKKAKTWMGGYPEIWANESHDLAVKVAYADVPADGPPPKLNEKYVQTATATVNEQLEKGGVRLADVLNRIYR